MKRRKHCTCCIVPPYIMEHPDFKDGFKNTVDFTKRVLDNRKTISQQIPGPTAMSRNPVGKAERYIYDSKNTIKSTYQLARKEGGAPSADAAANSVYENAGKVRDFYKQAYNYFSVDNNGKDLIMNIHYQEQFNNALWSSQFDQMFFGDGDGALLKNLTEPVDVIAHELTHGVVEYTAGLVYQGQSGALNEHIADVFATVIKQHYNGQNASNADWLIGDAVVGTKFTPKPGFTTIALRSVKDPGCAFNGDMQPANMANFYDGPNDNGGVHFNSGIMNKAFYLIASGAGMPAPGIDTAAGGALWFKSLKAIKVDTCDFEGFAKIVLDSAQSLMLDRTLPNGTDALIKAAFNSVGVNL
jgi:Zn-dependent metalloprotease